MSMVCRETGTYSSFLSKLCTSPNINVWSKWKPISLAKTAGITASDLANANYGFQIDSNHTALFTTDWTTILNAAKNNDCYYYKRPYGTSSSPYRLGDFRNLNQQAEPFWDRTIPVTATTEVNLLQLQAGVNLNAEAEIRPLDFSPITDVNKGQWYYMALYREVGGAASPYITTDNPLWGDGQYNEDAFCDIPVLTTSTIKRYECCLILAKYDSENDIITDALLVPNSYREITYNSNYTPFDIEVDYSRDPLFISTRSGDYCNGFIWYMNVLNVLSGVTNFNFTIKIKDSSGDLWSSTYSAATLSDGTISGTMTGCNFYIGDEPELDIHQVYGVLSYTYQGSTKTKFFDFTNEIVSSTTAYESGVDFYNQYCVSHS